jgi:hypothetical protein
MNLTTVSTLKENANTLVLFAGQDTKKLICDIKGTGLDEAVLLLDEAYTEGRFKGGFKETVFFRCVNRAGEHLSLRGTAYPT